MPTHYQELTREEMEYVTGGDFYWSKSTCQKILAVAGVLSVFGSTAAILAAGTAVYYTAYSLLGLATAALCANFVTGSIGLTVAGFLVTFGMEFVTCLVLGAFNDGIGFNTIRVFGFDTKIPRGCYLR